MNNELLNTLDKEATFLNLSNKSIKDISALKEFKNLTTLILNNNQIKDISPLKDLQYLHTLYLTNNEIENIEYQELKNLTKLRRLDLSNNQLTTFPQVLLNLDMQIFWEDNNNQGITLENNPINNIAPEVIRLGKKSIHQYFNSQKTSANEVKVLLVGDGSSGKTSLLNRILHDTYDESQSQTNGINIQSREFELEDRKIKLNFWDFGGQEKFYSTHNFFFTKRSLYILLVDSRKESKVEYWLEYIKSIAEHSPVMIVMNKIDQNPDFDLNRRNLLKEYSNIKGFYKISCQTKDGLEELYTQIVQKAIKDVELSQLTLPKGWWDIRETLQTLEKDFISYDQFQEICEEYEIIDEETQHILVNLYNDLGDITTYVHDNNQMILLNPNWIVEALYKIISSSEIQNGQLVYNDLKEILKNDPKSQFNYSPRKYDFIIDTMKEFKRCFETDKDKYILPDLLTPNSGNSVQVLEEELNQEDTNSLQVEFKYKFMPKVLITNFIVANKDTIKDNLIWKTGVVIENADKTSTAIVESHPTKRTITVQVWNRGKDDFFVSIIEDIKRLSLEYQNLNYKVLVPLEVDDNGDMKYISYKALQGYYKNNKNIYFDGELSKEFSVSKLLNGIDKFNQTDDISYNIVGDNNTIHLGAGNNIGNIMQNKLTQEKLLRDDRIRILEYNSKNLDDIENAKYYENNKNYSKAKELYYNILKSHKYHIQALENLIRILKTENISTQIFENDLIVANNIVNFEKNIQNKIQLKELVLQDLNFFSNQICQFNNKINIILGKNGFGKTYLLKLIVALAQNDTFILRDYFKNSGDDSYVKCLLQQDNKYKTILKDKNYKDINIGKIAILSVPDVRYLDKSKNSLEDRDDDKSNLRDYGSYHFLYDKPYEAIIETFLFRLGIDLSINKNSSLLKFIQKIFYRLNENEFEFVSSKLAEGYNQKIEIKVKTEGNERPIIIQKASQGTLSIIALFGLIYNYLKSLNPKIDEKDITQQNAIIAIDEIDAHLHPDWQQKIINLLRDNFPNVQFFVTAHSPLVVAGCYENEVNVLRKEEGEYELKNINHHFIGKKISELLNGIFEVSDIDENYMHYKFIERYISEPKEEEKYYIDKINKGL